MDTTFDCAECDVEIQPAEVLGAMASQGITEGVINDDKDLDMDCPQCDETVTLETAETVVKLAADDATLALLQTLREVDTAARTGWDPDFEEVVEQEREARERREQLEEKLEEIRDSL